MTISGRRQNRKMRILRALTTAHSVSDFDMSFIRLTREFPAYAARQRALFSTDY